MVPTRCTKKPVAMELILMDHEVNIFSYSLIILNMYNQLCRTDNSLISTSKQGSQVPAYIKRGLISNFKKLLKEDDTIKISGFNVEDNTPHKFQKARVNHPFKLHFTYVTKVLGCRPDTFIQSSGFNLIPFDGIPNADAPFYIGEC